MNSNTGIGVQEWGLGFQCLAAVATQTSIDSEYGDWHHILCNSNFAQMIYKFISGSGLNSHRSDLVSVSIQIKYQFEFSVLPPNLRELALGLMVRTRTMDDE